MEILEEINGLIEDSSKSESDTSEYLNPFEKEWTEYVNGSKGSFVQYIAKAFQVADSKNFAILYKAFPIIGSAFKSFKEYKPQK